jgi:hypothetical protein
MSPSKYTPMEPEIKIFILTDFNMTKIRMFIYALREKSFLITGKEPKRTKESLVTIIENMKPVRLVNIRNAAPKAKKVEVYIGMLTRTF